ALVVSVGDTIQGGNDSGAEAEWRQVQRILAPHRRFPFYPVPGNHDIWSAASEKLFRKYTERAPDYGFDYRPAPFTQPANSPTEEFSAAELAFLEQDLRAHAARKLKFIVSHRPSWLIAAVLQNPSFSLHRLAKQYGVKYVIAGHVHQMLHCEVEGITYLS